MKKLALLVPTILLTGCLATAPKFPDAPPELTTKCPELNEVAENTKELSKVLDVVVVNYSTYYECRIKVEAWQDWYVNQKKIYNDAAK
jgi:hypothetical protein